MDPNTLAVWKNLETRLDISFRDNMVDLVLEMARDGTIPPQKTATWMLATSTCICNAIFGTDNPMPLLSLYIRALEDQYPHTMQQIYNIFAEDDWERVTPPLPEQDEFIGILWAAGSTFANGEFKLMGNEITIGKQGLQRFKSIWKAPITFTAET